MDSDRRLNLSDRAREFREVRKQLNEIVLKESGIVTKRFFNLDTQAYADGALPATTKELLGLVASLVLRCDDCVMYHLLRCCELGVSDREFEETMSIGLIVGGSITIPHIRRAFREWVALRESNPSNNPDPGSE